MSTATSRAHWEAVARRAVQQLAQAAQAAQIDLDSGEVPNHEVVSIAARFQAACTVLQHMDLAAEEAAGGQ
jgi:hypothetical protein